MSNIFSISGEFLGTSDTINQELENKPAMSLLDMILEQDTLTLEPQYPEINELKITLEVVPNAL